MERIDKIVYYMNKKSQQSSFLVDIQNNYSPTMCATLPSFHLLEYWACQVFTHEKLKSAEVTLRLVDVPEMQALNQQYRQKNYPTNVLSFPADIPVEVVLDPVFLGDIILCVPVILQESIEQDKPLMSHWAHMVVHGVLHLLGYDHLSDQEAESMEKKEAAILQKCDVKNPYQNNEE